MTDHEKLIKDAELALIEALRRSPRIEDWVAATWAVFEKAHTATDDEREALIDVMVMTKLSDYAATDMSTIHQAVDAILKSDVWRFRRSEVPEPSAEVRPCLLPRSAPPCIGCQCEPQDAVVTLTAEAVEANREYIDRTQGEPSDAQVDAALEAFSHSDGAFVHRDRMRAALRAAMSLREEGVR